MENWRIRQVVDLTRSSGISVWPTLMVRGDSEAHRWEVVVRSGKQPVSLVGATVTAYFNRADNLTVPVKGTVAGNVVSVVLDAACYAVNGPMVGILRASTTDGMVLTLAVTRFTVAGGPCEQVYDPDKVVPGIDELLAQIDAMEEATALANDAAAAANAAALGLSVETYGRRVKGCSRTAEGNPAVFTPDGGSLYTPVTKFGPVQEGEGTPSLSNIRVLRPRSALAMTLKGWNLFDSSVVVDRSQAGIKTVRQADGRIRLTGTLSSENTLTRAIKSASADFLTLPPGTYTLSPSNFSLRYLTPSGATQLYNSGTFTLTEERTYVNAIWTLEYGVTYDEVVGIQLERGDKATEYHPFVEEFEQEFGEGLVGGSFDWSTGMLEGSWNMQELTGGENESWKLSNTQPTSGKKRYDGTITNSVCAAGITCICSHGEAGEANRSDVWVTGGSNQTITTLLVRLMGSWETADDLRAFLIEQAANGTPVQVAYPCVIATKCVQPDGHVFIAYDGEKEHTITGDETICVDYMEPLAATVERYTAPLIQRLEALEAARAAE